MISLRNMAQQSTRPSQPLNSTPFAQTQRYSRYDTAAAPASFLPQYTARQQTAPSPAAALYQAAAKAPELVESLKTAYRPAYRQ